jgi:8-oxo-dGTP pyrophosphatase MutT (NUDIX family)
MSASVLPAPAATVMVVRDLAVPPEGAIEVLLVKRHHATAFMGGACVFPGGRLEPGDAAAGDDVDLWCDGVDEALMHFRDLDRDGAIQYHVAAIRELFEEAGILLARDWHGRFAHTADPGAAPRFRGDRAALLSGRTTLRSIVERERLRLALDALKPLGHWVTPEVEPRRFDTRFFVARMPERQTAVHDAAETTESFWIRPADALARCLADEIVLGPPTWQTLKDVSAFRSVDDLIGWADRRRVQRVEPRFFQQQQTSMLVLPGDPLYPASRETAFHGDTRFVLERGRWRARPPDVRDAAQ